MAYQMVATTVTLNDLEGHSPLVDVLNAIGRTFVQHFTRFQLTVCSHGSSALAKLLVSSSVKNVHNISTAPAEPLVHNGHLLDAFKMRF